jgi:hypothetical protein
MTRGSDKVPRHLQFSLSHTGLVAAGALACHKGQHTNNSDIQQHARRELPAVSTARTICAADLSTGTRCVSL